MIYSPLRNQPMPAAHHCEATNGPRRRPSSFRHRWQTLRRRVEDLAIQLADGPDVEVTSWRLPAQATSCGRARHLIRKRLSAWGMHYLSDEAELLVSELVTNVLRHTCCDDLTIRLSTVNGLLRCEVEDCNGAIPKMRWPAPDDESGRGLHVLDSLACCWGTDRTRSGKIMWFELPSYARR
ncbi:ATP-binding protein [Microbispora sp. GKU 823]|uniref:ATP-binding protein n=1 Tax=Microbispora sp. GKU 823 TaxID=1652100 RepID=UPI00117FA4B2|nr:ATP-binding protein [Microbispora sp. GKU 823]